jgi:hypothetical protein
VSLSIKSLDEIAIPDTDEALMKLTDVNTRTLTALLSLTKKKESLMAKIAEVDKQIASLASGEAQAAIRVLRAKTRRGRKPTAKRSKPQSRSPKGWIEQEIKKVLQEVGDAGASVREIAEKIGKPVQNIHVWFSGTGRKTGLFEKTEQGRFRFKKA